MTVINKDVIIVGGGAGGLAAAVELRKQGIEDILIIEREKHLGGILNQCIHDGFGLTRFKETLSGPEYAQRFIDEVEEAGIDYITDTTVLDISADKKVVAVSKNGLLEYNAKAVVLTMGCRERTRGALQIPGSRPTGVYTAGVAQMYTNLKNTMVGRNVMILGSGDIGMIMARRLTLEGAKVHAVFARGDTPRGLARNVEQCLNDYNIPLYLSHNVTQIHGKDRLEGITISKVGKDNEPVPGTEKYYPCDTLILSVGLIPENELSQKAGVQLDSRTKGAFVDENYQTCVEGIFAAGNVLHVHDLVDFVSMEAEKLGDSVAEYIKRKSLPECTIDIETDRMIGYTIPQKISGTKDIDLSFRVRKNVRNAILEVKQGEETIYKKKLKKAVTSEMERIHLKKELFKSNSNIKVVLNA